MAAVLRVPDTKFALEYRRAVAAARPRLARMSAPADPARAAALAGAPPVASVAAPALVSGPPAVLGRPPVPADELFAGWRFSPASRTAAIFQSPEWEAKPAYEKAQARRDLLALFADEHPQVREALATASAADREALATQFEARLGQAFPAAFQTWGFVHAKARGQIHTVPDLTPVYDLGTEQVIALSAPRSVREAGPEADAAWAEAQARFRAQSPEYRRALAPLLYERYSALDMTDAEDRPLFGTLDEMIEARPGPARQAAAVALPMALRIAPPVAAGATGNPVIVVGAALGGDALAQVVEQKLGVREKFSPVELGINGAFSLIPAVTLGRVAASPALNLAARTGVRAAEGAAQGFGSEALRQFLEGESFDGDKLLGASLFGGGFGGLVGAFEPRIAALVAGKSRTDALAALRDALAKASPADRTAFLAALRQLDAASVPPTGDSHVLANAGDQPPATPSPITLSPADDLATVPHTAPHPAPEAISFATEHDRALTSDLRTLAAQDGAFQWPHSQARAIADIARDMSLPGYSVTVSGNPQGEFRLHSEKGGHIVLVPERETGTYHINSLDGRIDTGRPNTGGAQLYQTALTWAHNSGLTIVPDRHLYWINQLRRTSAMLSSALRHGTTDHMLPHADQRVPWIPGDHEANIAALARREAELVAQRLPDTKDWSIDLGDGNLRDRQGKSISRETAADALQDNGGSHIHGIGIATLRRALLTRAGDSFPGGIARRLSQDAGGGDGLARGILYAERTLGAGGENLGGDVAPATGVGFSETELKRELTAIRKAFPELSRRYQLAAGEVEQHLRAHGYKGEVPAAAIAALARFRGERDLIVIGARAFRDRASGAALLTHEVGHAYWDTLDDATRQTLRDLRARELETKTGPLFRAGQLDTRLAHVDEASERGVQEWFAERIARLNTDWAHGRLDRADLTLLRRLSYDLRQKIREIVAVLARREKLDPDSDLFEEQFRRFFTGGAQVEAGLPRARRSSVASSPPGKQSPETVSLATERDKALTGDWRTLAAQDGAFQWPHTDAKAPEDIARDMSLPGYGVTASSRPGAVFFDSEKRGFIAIFQHPKGGYFINSTDARGSIDAPVSGSTQLYQAALSWARNNGQQIVPANDISPINKLRRSSAMFSSALRHGTTEHMLPHPDQKVPWIPGDDAANIAALARREAELVAELLPHTQEWSIDPTDGTFRDRHGKRLTSGDVTQGLRHAGGPSAHGVGIATLRRALLTRGFDGRPEGIANILRHGAQNRESVGRGVLYAESAFRPGEHLAGGTGPENLDGNGVPASEPGFSEPELALELATIRKAFPALLRRYDLQAGEVEKLLRARGHTEEVSANAAAAISRLGGERGLIVFGARAFRDRATGAALLTHEVGHAYWDTLDDATRQTLRDLRTRELEGKTGPLFRDGQFQSQLAHVDEASERGVQEWFAERIARLNESWAHGRLDRADLPLLRRLAYSLREKLRDIWATLARRERLDPYSDLFESRFREFFAGGAQVEGRGPGSRDVRYAQESGAGSQPPAVRPWDAVKKGMPLDSVKKYIPKAQVLAPRMDFTGLSDDAIVDRVRDFLRQNAVVTAFDGRKVLVANPQGRGDGLRTRAAHLVGRREHAIGEGKREVAMEKASLVAAIPETLQHAALKAIHHNEHLYFRRYKDGLLHMVVVDPHGGITEHGLVDSALVTQYAPEPKYRFEGARILAKGEI